MGRISHQPMLDDEYDGRYYARGFEVEEYDNLLDLAEVITEEVWSPVVWRGGRRLKRSFMASDFWVFDFDEGKSIDYVKDAMHRAKLAHLIGLTKSHQQPKGKKPPCDRFRLVIPAHEPITDLETFEYNMRAAIERLGCDESCADGARFYFPCIDIHSMAPGKPLAWKLMPDDILTKEELDEIVAARHRANARRGVIPKWIHVMLKQGVPAGGRHKACYRLGANLTHYGFSASEIVALAMDSPLSAIGADDVTRAVANGIRRARGG
jgi:hypothetical protein